MASFDEAIKTVLKHEGGFVDDKDDRGGATNYGLSLKVMRVYCIVDREFRRRFFGNKTHIDKEDIKNLDEKTAKEIYKYCWWDKYKYENILDQSCSTKIFDIQVNIGPYQAHKIAQRVINIISSGYKIQEDGIFGSRTLNSLNITCPMKFLEIYRESCGDFYRKICRKNESLNKYLKGWLNRVGD